MVLSQLPVVVGSFAVVDTVMAVAIVAALLSSLDFRVPKRRFLDEGAVLAEAVAATSSGLVEEYPEHPGHQRQPR